MSEYRAPLEDMRFVLEHIVDLADLATLPGCESADPEVVAGLLEEEAGKFASEVLSPLNSVGDRQGLRLENGQVIMPDGFKEAYAQFTRAGWNAVAQDERFGGAGLPRVVATAVQEMVASANMSFGMCPALGEGAMEALFDHGSEELKQQFLPKLVPGDWSGTMALTEPQAGTDLAAIRCTAEPAEDGSYRLRGTKIFITFGDHDMVENVVHLVLARTPGAPPGIRGISCFVVPKYLVGPDGAVGARNEVQVVSLEHKLGIHASPTCVLSFGERDGAVGWLIGEENRGLQYMFTMMNRERIFVACQGLAVAERAYARAAEYARERRQGRAIGADVPPGEASLIVEHADVRRMLLGMKATVEATRCLLYVTAAAGDRARHHPDPAERKRQAQLDALLTPVAKHWCTEVGMEVTSTAIQVFGGMGYVEETGMPQYFRDARIPPIYEGTNGIQALDLVNRKLPMEDGAVVRGYLAELSAMDAELAAAGSEFASIRSGVAAALGALSEATEWLLEHRDGDPQAACAAATPYAEMFGLASAGAWLARSALVARGLPEGGPLAEAKRVTARFYAEQMLPRVAARLPAVKAGADDLFALAPEQF